MRASPILLALALAVPVVACGPTGMSGPTMNNKIGGNQLATATVVSTEILRREPRTNHAKVKHILISWKDKVEGKGGADARALARTKRDAEREIRALQKQVAAGADFEQLMHAHSEDPGSADTGESYDVSPDAQLVIEFRQLGLRLDVDEVGVVESDYGFHLIKRVE
ncbi:MAG: peptidylprolyl isomerase [Myxococcales bacterium]|nr:peptidylprolyl isomerase [Myxococcales bacterium]